MITIPQRHRQTDGRTDGQLAFAIPRFARLRTVKIIALQTLKRLLYKRLATKACTSIAMWSSSSVRRTRRNCLSWKKHWLTQRRCAAPVADLDSGVMRTPRTRVTLETLMVSHPSVTGKPRPGRHSSYGTFIMTYVHIFIPHCFLTLRYATVRENL